MVGKGGPLILKEFTYMQFRLLMYHRAVLYLFNVCYTCEISQVDNFKHLNVKKIYYFIMKVRYFIENIRGNIKKKRLKLFLNVSSKHSQFVIASICFIWTHLFPHIYSQLQTHTYILMIPQNHLYPNFLTSWVGKG